MRKTIILLSSLLCLLLVLPVAAAETDHKRQLQISPFYNSSVSAPFFKKSYGYAFFPTIGKGGIGIGGAYGKGEVFRNGKLTGRASLYKLTIGFQLGGQVFSEIIFFEDKRAYQEFINGAFELDASASAVAITAGAQASAGTAGASAGVSVGPNTGEQLGGKYVNGSAIFIHTRGGLMYEAAIGGQKFKFHPLMK
ncbi:MAG: hypothetical protein L3J63_09165 [Geopsychrobacter sp.]|nr:hypothetical protein [Geopsychrobacter sp.]